jgi:hypothetical protein
MNVPARFTVPDPARCGTSETSETTKRWLRLVAGTLVVVGLFGWQTWLTMGLFGDAAWTNLTNEAPLMSGAHPANLTRARLAAQALRQTGTLCWYDLSQAGTPMTPIFDGCRFADLFLFVVDALPGKKKIAPETAYKLCLAILCLAVPALLLLACWGAGLDIAATAVACSLGLAVWWGPHGRAAVEAGDTEVILGSLAVLAHVALLIRFNRNPGIRVWTGLFLTGAFSWLAQPMLIPIALPLLLVYYLSAGVRHAFPWHLALLAAEAGAIGVNVPWLTDWVNYWWLRAEFPSTFDMLPHRTFATIWDAPIWGGPSHRALAMFLFASAAVGFVIWHRTRCRPAARLLGLGAIELLVLALLGISWEPMGQMGAAIFLSPALWFACLPAAHGWTQMIGWLARNGLGRLVLFLAALGLGAAICVGRGECKMMEGCVLQAIRTEPLQFGLTPERQHLVATLEQYTTRNARILWEDRKLPRRMSRWSVMLPLLTDRWYLGGVDPDGALEISSISFLSESLERRKIADWSDRSLAEYCKRYDVGWVVAWSPSVIERFRRWSGVDREIAVKDDVAGVLFALKPQGGGFVMKGRAEVVEMDTTHIALANVVPEGGEVVLNLHYIAGLRATPSRVQVDAEPSGQDPIGFIRLKMTDETQRLTLTWDRAK